MTNSKLRQALQEMRQPLPGAEYYAVTLTATEEGRVEWGVQSRFAGVTDDFPRTELRAASIVHPDRMANLWTSIGQPHVVVNTSMHLMVYKCVLGGNGLVEKSLADEWEPEWSSPSKVVRLGFGGFDSVKGLPPEVFNRAPTPKLRMNVLKRDKRRCRICGRSPDSNTDIELHIHHIRPWGEGGVTHAKNLITLCHTCHNGLNPHHDPSLFEIVDSGLAAALKDFDKKHHRGVQIYRAQMRQRWIETEEKGARTSAPPET